MLCALQTLAVFFLVALIIFTSFVFRSIREAWRENARFEQKHVAHISFCDLIHYYNSRIYIDLTIDSPHGILLVDDPITISGVANTSEFTRNITSITAGFYNAQACPVTQDNNGITNLAEIKFHNAEDNKLIANETAISWPLEGLYQLVVALEIDNNEVLGAAPITSTFVTIHPKSLMVQIITNKTNINLAIAAYFLGLIGAINVIYRLWIGT